MASTYSTNLALELIGTGEQSGTWGTTTNTNLGTLIEQSISGYVTQAITDGSGANTTITIPNGTTGVARNMFIEMTGALTFATTSLIVPANKKMYFIFNNTTGGFAVTVKVSGLTGVLVPNGKKVILTCNGTDIVEAHTAIVGNATMGGTLGVTGATTLSSTLGVTGASTFAAATFSSASGTLAANSYTGASRSSTTGFTRVHNIEGADCSLQLRETTTNSSWEIGNDNTGLLRFLSGGTNRMTVTAAGAVAIPGTLRVTGQFSFGERAFQNSTTRISVAGATTIYSIANGGSSVGSSAALVLVNGYLVATPTNSFIDLVLFMPSGTPSVISAINRGSPAARTYTSSGSSLQLAMASGTYNVANSNIEQAC
jgi:fibronectin-binding autotransporter adhesin